VWSSKLPSSRRTTVVRVRKRAPLNHTGRSKDQILSATTVVRALSSMHAAASQRLGPCNHQFQGQRERIGTSRFHRAPARCSCDMQLDDVRLGRLRARRRDPADIASEIMEGEQTKVPFCNSAYPLRIDMHSRSTGVMPGSHGSYVLEAMLVPGVQAGYLPDLTAGL